MPGRSIAVALVGLLLGACQSTVVPSPPGTFPSPASTQSTSVQASPAATTAASIPAHASPASTEAASTAPLPNPGGTCLAGQFDVGTSKSGYTFSTATTRHVVVRQALRNVGAACVLALPKIIGVVGATGLLEALRVPNMGHVVYSHGAGRSVYPTSFKIASGQSVTVVLNAWWWSPLQSGTATGPPPPRCDRPIVDVARAEFPLASGTIEIEWDTVLQEVCRFPVSMNMTIESR